MDITGLINTIYGGYAAEGFRKLSELVADPELKLGTRRRIAYNLARFSYAYGHFDLATLLMERHEVVHLSDASRRLYALLLLAHEKFRTCLDLLEVEGNTLPGAEAAFVESACHYGLGDRKQGLDRLNDVFVKNGMLTLAYAPKANVADTLPHLHAPKWKAAKDGPKLSIIIPAYNAEDTIVAALRGIVEQTYKNVEAIVVVDNSPDRTADVAEKFAKTDPRIRVIRQDVNTGPYKAQNRGLMEATGKYARTHGADDWLHPQATEIQMRAMLEAGAATSVSYALGVLPGLKPTPLPGASVLLLRNMSSFIFDREAAIASGGYDDVRFSGDGEFYARMKKATGSDPLEVTPTVPLSLLLSSEGSLSGGGDFGRARIRYGARWEYKQAYADWHRRMAEAGGIPTLDILPEDLSKTRDRRPIATPKALLQKDTSHSCRRLLIGDFADEVSYDRIVKGLRGFGEDDMVFHCPKPANAQAPFVKDFRKLLRSRGCDVLVAGESLSCETVVLTDPDLLRHRLNLYPKIASDKWIVMSEPKTFKADQPLFATAISTFFLSDRTSLTLSRRAP